MSRNFKAWSQAEVDFLVNNPRVTAAYAAAILGRTRRGVLRKKERLRVVGNVHRKVGAELGEKHPRAVLTEEKVREMRARYAAGGVTYMILSREYGIGEGTVSAVLTRRTWRHVR